MGPKGTKCLPDEILSNPSADDELHTRRDVFEEGMHHTAIGIVQTVFSEKASAIARMRQECVRNASNMRQKCVRMGLLLLGKEGTSKMRHKLRQNCVKNARNTFGGEHLLDDTDAMSLWHAIWDII